MMGTLPGRASDAGPETSADGIVWHQAIDLAIEELIDAKQCVGVCRSAKDTQVVKMHLDSAERHMDAARREL